MSVDVEYRHEDQDERLQHPGSGGIAQELPQGEEAGILAVDLARVYAPLNQQHRQVALARLGGGECAGAGNHQCQHRPPFRSSAELHAAHGVVPLAGIGRAQALDFLVTASPLKLRFFRDSLQTRVAVRGCGVCRGHRGRRKQCSESQGGQEPQENAWLSVHGRA